ncbi:hypothetical protein E3N88_24458 [Mikania micrantha]|uniref:Phytosulfokine n=1 Tax=Mikania micrantha TaxID=192012 RepID=A0A5N6N3L6_9ASTR|nr:hypothetical protein E3N88_24458 [Mikania micrantha]
MNETARPGEYSPSCSQSLAQLSYVFVYDDSKQSNPEEGYEEKPAASNVNWETKEEFISEEALVGWVKSRALDNGYIVVKRKTKKLKSTGSVIKVWLMCDRGGEHNSIAILRRSGENTIKVDESINAAGESSVGNPETGDRFKDVMGLEDCGSGDEDCLKRRLLADAHLDYIYTQHHKH